MYAHKIVFQYVKSSCNKMSFKIFSRCELYYYGLNIEKSKRFKNIVESDLSGIYLETKLNYRKQIHIIQFIIYKEIE